MTAEETTLYQALADPFDPRLIKWKPQVVKGNRALAVAYIDARLVSHRLDQVLGPGGWRTDFVVLNELSVECRLSIKVAGEWVTRADVGSASEQPDAGDRMKAAYSDALKRAAVHFGVGRYLYKMPQQWLDYDPQKKAITGQPQIPAWALPAAVREALPAQNGKQLPEKTANPTTPVSPPKQDQKVSGGPAPNTKDLPKTGAELEKRVTDFDRRLCEAGYCRLGEVAENVLKAGKERKYPDKLGQWDAAEQIEYAMLVAKTYGDQVKARTPQTAA